MDLLKVVVGLADPDLVYILPKFVTLYALISQIHTATMLIKQLQYL